MTNNFALTSDLERKLDLLIAETQQVKRLLDQTDLVWCSVVEAATLLGCTKWNVYRRVNSGHIRSKKVGGKVLVYKADLLQPDPQ